MGAFCVKELEIVVFGLVSEFETVAFGAITVLGVVFGFMDIVRVVFSVVAEDDENPVLVEVDVVVDVEIVELFV